MLKVILVVHFAVAVGGVSRLDTLLAEVEETLPVDTGFFGPFMNLVNKNEDFREEYRQVVEYGHTMRRDRAQIQSQPEIIELEIIKKIQGLIDSSRGLIAEDVDLVIAYELSWKLLDELLRILKSFVKEQPWTSDIFAETYLLMKHYMENQVQAEDRRVCIQILDALMHPRSSKANLGLLKKYQTESILSSVAVLKSTAERMQQIQGVIAASSLTSLFPLPNPPPLQTSFTAPPVETAGISPDIKLRFENQLEEDRGFSPISSPYLIYDSEIIYTDDNIDKAKIIKLGTLISRKSDAMIFRAADSSPLVIKYQCNCYEPENPVYDLYRDYWLQKEVNGRGISPPVYFLSPPAKFPPYITPKIEFNFMNDRRRAECAASSSGEIRYMVMGLIHKSVADLMKESGSNVVTGLQVAISLIPKLKILHVEKRIIHGDVHPGNVVVLSADRPDDFGLIDYGKSKFFSEIPTSTSQGPPMEYQPFCSPATWADAESSFREDVSTALLTAATLINGDSMFLKCGNVEGSNFAYVFGDQFSDDLKDLLNQVLALATAVEADASPDYDEMTRLLIEVRDTYVARGSSVPINPHYSVARELGLLPEINGSLVDEVSVPIQVRD